MTKPAGQSERALEVGLVGYGTAGSMIHAPLISGLSCLQLRSVVERKTERSKSRYPQVTVVRSLDELLEDAGIEVVVIATPNATHLEQATKALEAGKSVVIDKPFTVRSSDADQLIELARSRKRILTVFQNRRLDGPFLTVKAVIEKKLLGRLVEYEACYDRFRNFAKADAWREKPLPGSGIFYDLGSHLVDQVLSIFGIPQSLSADIRVQRAGQRVDDSFDLRLDYPGLKVVLRGGMLMRQPRPHFMLHGSLGSFVKQQVDGQIDALAAAGAKWTPEWGVEPEANWGMLNTQIDGLHYCGKLATIPGNYFDFYQNLYDAVRNGGKLLVDPLTARDTVRIIELGLQSSAEKRSIDCREIWPDTAGL